MGTVIYSANYPGELRFAETAGFRFVRAGFGNVVGITASGRAVQKTMEGITGAPSIFGFGLFPGKRVTSFAMSQSVPGALVAEMKDGRWLAKGTRETELSFGWQNVVTATVSDCIFGLRRDGTVCGAFLEGVRPDYEGVRDWQNVRRLVTGNQESVFGITGDGRVLCAGANTERNRKALEALEDVVDLCPMGAECEQYLVLHADGSLRDLDGKRLCQEKIRAVRSNFLLTAAQTEAGNLLFFPYMYMEPQVFAPVSDRRVTDFAVGYDGGHTPFVVALKA